MFAMLTCLGLCGVMLAGCSRNDDNSGSTSSGVTATTTSKNEVTSRRDDSDTLVSRVGDGIKDTVSGGADIIDDTCNFDREQNFTKILHEKTTADRLI